MKTTLNRHFLILALLILIASGVAGAANPSNDIQVNNQLLSQKAEVLNEQYIPDEIIVKFKDGVKDKDKKRIRDIFGASELPKGKFTRFERLKIPSNRNVQEMVRLYKNNPLVEYAEPDYIAHAMMVPNDPYFGYQWNFYNSQYGGINVKDAWDITNGSNVIVAVIDTGVAYENYCQSTPSGVKCYYKAPDLAGTSFVQGYDFANSDNHANDDNSHGTHVAGTIAQTTNNGIGVAGVAFGAKIMPIKALDSSGSGSYSWIADGIIYAADNGAKVISMSLGGTFPSFTLENALAYAYSKGVTIIAAAGNGGAGGQANYPAAYDDYVIAVAATRYDETRSYYSTTGNYVDVAAPGGDTTVDQNGDGYGDGVLQQTFNPTTKNTNAFGYWFFQGTSMATPHVSGVAALLIANGKNNPADVREALEKTAEDKGTPGKDSEYGYGIIDAKAALLYNGQQCTDIDQDSYCAETNDCDDSNAGINPAASDSNCNGIDNNCNSFIDENYAPYSCGTGACQAQSTCANGIEQCTEGIPAAEDCNGIDDDCNGITDDNLVAPLCENQIGVCSGSTKSCGGFSGWLACGAANYGIDYQFNESSCFDNLDNDCDGLTDINDFNCLVCIDNDNDGYGTNCALGNDCNDNDNTVNPGASDSNCNNIDNNCDGQIDEAYVSTPTNCGTGACASSGQLLCQSGALVNTCTPGTPSNEVCNNIDDDCNGVIDNGNVCAVKCWSATNLYLVRGSSQFKKFCKCAQGTYAYKSYGSVSGTKTAYKYTNTGDNTNWATTTQQQSSPASRVRCADNVLYYTNKDYYR
ncbi:S8 family serine peptidase [Candidatus Woesearchaeota archaeon]|nr:S8 family serine peptidase [Candidatus Woesearchaeota archaeon]